MLSALAHVILIDAQSIHPKHRRFILAVGPLVPTQSPQRGEQFTSNNHFNPIAEDAPRESEAACGVVQVLIGGMVYDIP